MEFPQLRNRHGGLVILYTTQAGGERPLHGAYLAKDGDQNVWVPCSWTQSGFYKEGRETGLDIEGWEEQLAKKEAKQEEANRL